jgi:succinylarginine dihydrolase
MALVIPQECQENAAVARYLEGLVNSGGPVDELIHFDLRQSMRNGGGPACLRLRVVADPATVDPRFLLDEARIARLEAVVAAHWPVEISPGALGDPRLWQQARTARAALLDELELRELA